MFRKLLRKIVKPIVGKAAASIIAEQVDAKVKAELDKRTGGLASTIDKAV